VESLERMTNALDELFRIEQYGKDPAFSRFLPDVYDRIGFDWAAFFEERFCRLFNGLMIKGQENVGSVFLAVFPTDQVLRQFIDQSQPGDLLFMHHPLLMECGDPKGAWGRGFVPIDPYLRYNTLQTRQTALSGTLG
jgi:hypothetical protein